jgi:hypothetical protein
MGIDLFGIGVMLMRIFRPCGIGFVGRKITEARN